MGKLNKEIYLQFTRPFNLYLAEFWRSPLLVPNVKKFLGKGLSDQICYSDGKTQYYYRLVLEMQLLKKHVLSLNPKDAVFSEENSKTFRERVGRMRKLMEHSFEEDEIRPIYRKAKKTFEELYPYYYFSYFIGGPWAFEYRAKWGKDAKRALHLQYENRVCSEGLLKQFSNFIELLCIHKLGDFAAEIDTTSLRFGEVEDLLLRARVPSRKLVKLRENGYVYAKGRLYLSDDLLSVIRKHGYSYEPKEAGKVEEFVGEVVCKAGKALGKVRLIFKEDDLGAFRKGEILVAPMTQPIYMPAMRKAAAIVTDEGEITSHAAIACRELRKPCLIGTNSASLLLKDGDLLEVDTEKGVARKVHKR